MDIQDFDKWIEIEDGELITFGELSHRVAIALFPSYEEGIGYEMAMIDLPGQIRHAVDSGRLVIRNPVTREEDRLPGKDSVILPHDLRPYLAARAIGLRVIAKVSPTDTANPQPAAAASWSEARKLQLLTDHEALKRARNIAPTETLAKQNGVSGTVIRNRLKEAKKLRQTPTVAATPFDSLFTK